MKANYDFTLKNKFQLLYGKNLWQAKAIDNKKIFSLRFSDGPSGIRKETKFLYRHSSKATCFPSLSTLANTWNLSLAYEVGVAIAQEARKFGIHVLLGPGLNLKRNPKAGRNFEFFSEDPYLTGKFAAYYIKGVQKMKVVACPKHFLAYHQETKRQGIDNYIDSKTLHELYLIPFEIAIKESKPLSIMTSYNKVNGKYVSENSYFLKTILREQWGFEGIVISDWNSAHDIVNGIKAGMNIEMPGSRRYLSILKNGYKNGQIALQDINSRVEENFRVYSFAHTIEKIKINWNSHHELARKVSLESIVLLKNEKNVLPITPLKKVAIIGDFARDSRYQGYGSSKVNPKNLENFIGLKKDFPFIFIGYEQGYTRQDRINLSLEKKALQLALKADVILFFFGTTEGMETEGADRKNMQLPNNQIHLLERLSALTSNIIGILHGGCACEMPWISYCSGLLYVGLGGEAMPSALLSILSGKANPSGKLTESYALKEKNYPTKIEKSLFNNVVMYKEKKNIGYRYFERHSSDVLFPFGYGLSYSTFQFMNFSFTDNGLSFLLKNIGQFDGAEVCQLYIKPCFKDSYKELKGFTKVFLKKNEIKEVVFSFDEYTFRSWNSLKNCWEIKEGEYQIIVGTHVHDVQFKEKIFLEYRSLECFHDSLDFHVDLAKNNFLTLDDTVYQLQGSSSKFIQSFAKKLNKIAIKSLSCGKPNLYALYLSGMTLRSLVKNSKGLLSYRFMKSFLKWANKDKKIFKTESKFIGFM